jgi:hypothetical protein
MDSVVKAFLNVFKGIDSETQWARVVCALSQMSRLEIAQTWVAILATTPKESESKMFALLLGYKLLFKQALKEVAPLQTIGSENLVDISNVNRLLRESIKICSEYETCLLKLRNGAYFINNNLVGSESASTTPDLAPIGHAPATIAPPSAELLQRVSELEKQARAPSAQEAGLQAKFEELKGQVKESAKQALGKLEARLKQQQVDREKEDSDRTKEQTESYTRLTDQLSGFGRKLDEAKLDIVNDTLLDLRRKADTAINARTEADNKVTALGTRLQALEDAGKSPAAAAGVDEVEIRRIAQDVFGDRLGDVAYTKHAADKVVAEADAKISAALEKMITDNDTAVVGLRKGLEAKAAECDSLLGQSKTLFVDLIQLEEEAKTTLSKIDEFKTETENEVGAIDKALVQIYGREYTAKKQANLKDREGPSPYRAAPFVVDPPKHKPTPAPGPQASKPAAHGLPKSGTQSMFSSIFGESPYVFADD